MFTAGVIRQCGGTVAAPQCDQAVAGQFHTGATRHLPATLVSVKRIINTGSTTFNCGVQACALVATAGDKSAQHHISILGAGTSIPDTSSPATAPPTTAGTIPPPTSSTITTPTTIPPPTTTVPIPSGGGLICDILGALRNALGGGFLGGLLDGLLTLFNCPIG